MNTTAKLLHKSKSHKISVPKETSTTIIVGASNLVIDVAEQQPLLTPANVKKMRAIIAKAYDAITVSIANVIKTPKLKAKELSGLTVSLSPALGYWSFTVNHTLPNGNVQPYKFIVLPQDGSNTYLRTLRGQSMNDADLSKANALLAGV